MLPSRRHEERFFDDAHADHLYSPAGLVKPEPVPPALLLGTLVADSERNMPRNSSSSGGSSNTSSQLKLLRTAADCLAVLERAVNWEAEKLYGVEALGPFEEF
jgi:hypothetical protein